MLVRMPEWLDIGDNGRTLEDLHQQLASNLGVVPFVGAGMCVPCGLPSWSSLLLNLAETCGLTSQVKALIDVGRFEEAASSLEQTQGGVEFTRSLKQRLILEGPRQIRGAITWIPALTRGPVITTNFDDVLESVFQIAGLPFPRVGSGPEVEAVWGALHQDQPFLVKIHGGVDEPATRVLTTEEYQRAYGGVHSVTSPSLPGLLEQIFTSRTLLFVGCSLHTDRTLLHLQRVKLEHAAPPIHFAIMEDPGDPGGRDKRTEQLGASNIRPVWYPQHRHDLIGSLLAQVLEPRFCPASIAPQKARSASELGRCIAIDFGTTFSAVGATVDARSFEYLRMRPSDAGVLIPTVVRFLDRLRYTIADDAGPPGATVLAEFRHFKRELGSSRTYQVGRREYLPLDLAALFLRGIRNYMEIQFEGQLPEVIAAAPANFDSRQTGEFAGALRSAGFRLNRIIGEPCAAALNIHRIAADSRDVLVLVVDVGGGTTDVSLVSRVNVDGETQVEVVTVAGDNRLGGTDFDDVVCKIVADELERRLGRVGHKLFEHYRAEIASQAVRAKIQLNSLEVARVTLGEVELEEGRLGSVEIEIRRSTFHAACSNLVQRLERLIDEVIRTRSRLVATTSGIAHAPVKYLLLAGQGGRLLPIRTLLQQKLRLPIIDQFEDIAVTRGLAHEAAVLGDTLKDLLLLDILYRSICVRLDPMMKQVSSETHEESYEKLRARRDANGRRALELLAKDVTIPIASMACFAMPEHTTSIKLEVYEASNDPGDQYLVLKRIAIEFGTPATHLGLMLDVYADRSLYLHVVADPPAADFYQRERWRLAPRVQTRAIDAPRREVDSHCAGAERMML
jgi:molecular chaperone DnaK (HSP70)